MRLLLDGLQLGLECRPLLGLLLADLRVKEGLLLRVGVLLRTPLLAQLTHLYGLSQVDLKVEERLERRGLGLGLGFGFGSGGSYP